MGNRNKVIFVVIWLLFVISICWYDTSYQKNYSVRVSPESGDIFEFRVSGKSGLINVSNGEVIVSAKYDTIFCKSEGFCITELNSRRGIINLNGKTLVDNIYDKMYLYDNTLIVEKDQKYSIIDIQGNTLLGPLDEGVFIISIKSPYVIIRKDQQYSVIDMQGNIVVDYLPVNTNIYFKNSNTQIVYITNLDSHKTGFINLEENAIFEPVYECSLDFVDKISIAKLNDKYGLVNDKNEVVVEFIYDEAHPFNEGLALVQYKSKYGYIDKLGNVVIDFQYDAASDFIDGVAHVEFSNSDGFINKNNEKVIPIHNSSHEIEYKNYYYFDGEKYYYYVNNDGTIFYKNCNEDHGFIIDDTKIINQKGDVILDKDVHKIEFINDNMFCIKSNNWECYDMEGEKLFGYDDSINLDFFFEDSPFFNFSNLENKYVYDDDGNLIYKNSRGEGNVYISHSYEFIVTTKGNKIISYDINTKEKKVIYKVPFTFKSLYDWR